MVLAVRHQASPHHQASAQNGPVGCLPQMCPLALLQRTVTVDSSEKVLDDYASCAVDCLDVWHLFALQRAATRKTLVMLTALRGCCSQGLLLNSPCDAYCPWADR